MLAALGFATIAAFLAATLSGRISVIVALVAIPVIFGLLTGAGSGLGPMMLAGLMKVAPVAIMVTFALLYFGLMLDRGLFDPIIGGILRLTREDPLRVCIATVVLTIVVGLDGDGSTTFLISIAAMRPIFDRLGMSRLTMTTCVGLAAGIMNITPWGGPTARAMAVLGVEADQLFNPLIVPMAAGLLWSIGVAAVLGIRERRRIGYVAGRGVPDAEVLEPVEAKCTPRVFWFNAALTSLLLVALLMSILPLSVLFILAFVIALVVNCPTWEQQQKQLASHASTVVLVTAMIFAAGIFAGILGGTKMIVAMSEALVSIVPRGIGDSLPLIVAVASMPLSLVLTPDAFYFGVLPILTNTATSLGLDPLDVARAALLGHTTTGMPLSPLIGATFVLIGRGGVTLGAHQKALFLWALGSTVVMMIVARMMGVI